MTDKKPLPSDNDVIIEILESIDARLQKINGHVAFYSLILILMIIFQIVAFVLF